MKLATLALFAGAASAEYGFPSFSGLHAHCEITADNLKQSCDSLNKEFDTMLTNFKDPSNGQYTLHASGAGYTWATRLTKNKKYTDNVIFEFSDDGNGGCNLDAKSQSISLSFYDFDVNFCNMYNVIESSSIKGTKLNVKNCRFHPDDSKIQSTCAEY